MSNLFQIGQRVWLCLPRARLAIPQTVSAFEGGRVITVIAPRTRPDPFGEFTDSYSRQWDGLWLRCGDESLAFLSDAPPAGWRTRPAPQPSQVAA